MIEVRKDCKLSKEFKDQMFYFWRSCKSNQISENKIKLPHEIMFQNLHFTVQSRAEAHVTIQEIKNFAF
jgi:hypothetical protein